MKQGVKHTIKENNSYFLTMTVVNWVDIFSRKSIRNLVIGSLKFCIKNKGLNVYAYCIMTNHIHMIVNCDEPYQLKDTIRDFKKFVSNGIIDYIKHGSESRRLWMLRIFNQEAQISKKHQKYKVWFPRNHAIELYSEKFIWTKVNYIHQNPVKAGFVVNAEDWVYSSASNYAEAENSVLPEVSCLTPRLITVS